MDDAASAKVRIYIRRYDDLRDIGPYICKRVCKTPPQACDPEWKIKGSRHIDRIAKGNDRAICGMI